MFRNNGRVERNNGIRFYEQDLLCSDYVFTGDMIIDLTVDYLYPGIGILLAADNGKPANEADHVYLFKLGDNDFRVIEKHFLSQSTSIETSCAFASSKTNVDANLIFSKRGQMIQLSLVVINPITGVRELRELGRYTFKDSLDKYHIGFYSNAGNTLKRTSITSGIPQNWLVNIKNTNGGRVAFFRDGFTIEGCEYDAELEQQDILLTAGTYYVGFEKELINEKNDIQCYVFYSSDTNFDDAQKNIMENGQFTLDQADKVNIKFKGTCGKITDICIKDLPTNSFVETDLTPVTQDGSEIIIDLTAIKSVRWKGIIHELPEYTDFTKKPPYAIVATENQRLTQQAANIDLKKEYQYDYDTTAKTLTITQDSDFRKIIPIDLRDSDNNLLKVFHNMTAMINELILTDESDQEINVLLQKTYRQYVPGRIKSPIIVVDEYDLPLDLSAAYREIVDPVWDMALFNQYEAIILPYQIFDRGEHLLVYGIPNGAIINTNRRDAIEYFSDRYTLLDKNKYSINYALNQLTIDTKERQLYKYIAVKYKHADKFTYLFTNWEREVFSDPQAALILSKPINDVSGCVVVYGIPLDANTNPKYIYHIPNSEMVNSIDLYAKNYDVINENEFTINFARPEIEISPEIRKQYKAFVIDYLKDDSYCINYLENYDQYEVEISSSKDRVFTTYDLDANGAVVDYTITAVKPDKNKYIVLRKI